MSKLKNTQMINRIADTSSLFLHEIRNPLAILKHEIQFLQKHHPELMDDSDLNVIQDTLSYIFNLLDDYSSFRHAAELTVQPTNLQQYLMHLSDMLEPTLDYLHIKLELTLPATPLILLLDQQKFRQALINLISNAQDAISEPNGCITICCETVASQNSTADFAQDHKQVLLSISDNGHGMDSEQLSSIFLPFVTHKPNGTGLGLAITKEIIEAHGGTIHVESIPNQGTSFRILLG